jgi:hypothetical protein
LHFVTSFETAFQLVTLLDNLTLTFVELFADAGTNTLSVAIRQEVIHNKKSRVRVGRSPLVHVGAS